MARRALAQALAFVVGLAIAAPAARAQEAAHEAPDAPSDYCRKVTAEARSDASLLFAPTVTAQAIKYPESGIADAAGLQVGSGWQPRIGLRVGLIDMVRGAGVLDVARADCLREARGEVLRELIAQKDEIGRLPALERERAYRAQRRPDVRALVTRAEERLAAKVSTVLEVIEIRRRALEFDRKAARVDGEIAAARKRPPVVLSEPLRALVRDYDARALAYEERVSHVRSLEPWKLDVSGGVVAHPVVDVFGVVELSYNFGGLVRNPAENRRIEAREREIATARYELHAQAMLLLDELRANVAEMRTEIEAIDAHLGELEATRRSIAGLDASNGAQVLASLQLETIELEAERTYLAALVEQRGAMEVDHASR